MTALLPARPHTVAMAPPTSPPPAGCTPSTARARRWWSRYATVADDLSDTADRTEPVRALLDQLEAELLPHEHAEEAELLPIMARALGGADADRRAQPHPRRDRAPGRPAAPDPRRPRRHSPTRRTWSSCGGCSTASTRSCGCTTRRKRRVRSASCQPKPRRAASHRG